MAVKIAPTARQQFEDANGNPYVGGKLFTYAAGSSTKQATYTDSTGLSANTNPIILDSAGRTPYGVWLTAGLNYKFVLAPSTDTDPPSSPIFTEDVVSGVNDTTTTTSQWIASGATPTYINATQFTLVGDKTADFHVGRRLKFTVTAGTVYGLITASAYTTLTTVTVVMDSGALDTGLSAVELSILTATGSALPGQIKNYIERAIGTASGNIPVVGTKSATDSLAGLVELATQAEAEAGTDDTVVPTTLKVAQAIARLALGGGAQTWQNVLTTPGRAIGSTYTNTTSRPIEVSMTVGLAGTNGEVTFTVAGTLLANPKNANTSGFNTQICAVVPVGASYILATVAGVNSITSWAELR